MEGELICWQGNSWRRRLLEFGSIAGSSHAGAVAIAVIRIGLCPDRRAGRTTRSLRQPAQSIVAVTTIFVVIQIVEDLCELTSALAITSRIIIRKIQQPIRGCSGTRQGLAS